MVPLTASSNRRMTSFPLKASAALVRTSRRLVSLSRAESEREVEIELPTVGNQLATLGPKANAQPTSLRFLGHGAFLVENEAKLTRTDHPVRTRDRYLDLRNIALAPFRNGDDGDDDLLQSRAAMHKAAARAGFPQSVDQLRDQDLHRSLQAQLLGRPFAQAVYRAQAVPQREPAIVEMDACALNLCGRKVALLDRTVLVEESVIGGDDNVARIRAG